MAQKQRFRDIKKGKTTNITQKNRAKKPTIPFASNGKKAKAFLTDIFLIFMPILYFVIYVIMGGREGAGMDKLLTWTYVTIPFLIILTIFIYKDEGKSPGLRSQSLKVIDFDTLDKPSLFSTIFRNFALILTVLTFFGWIIMFFRQDKRGLHDLLSNTCVVPYTSKESQ